MKKAFAIVLALCLLVSVLPVATFAASPFADLTGHWAESYVLPLYEKGIISGKSATVFDPEANMTRAEFVTLALKVPAVPTPNFEKPFDDVDANQWFADTVSEAKRRNLIPAEMVENNMFKPDQPITREEMTAIIVRLWESFRGILTPAELNFTDIASFSPWATDSIAKAVSLGVITGNPDGSFNPAGRATRAEASVIFSRFDKQLNNPVVTIKNGEFHPMYGDIYHDDVDIQKMVSDAYASGAKEVTIPKGVYKIKQTRTAHLTLDGMKDFTINAYGVTLIFDKHYGRGVQMMGCDNITINGLTVDYEEPLFTQAKIVGIDPDGFYFDMEIEDGYYKNLSDNQFFTGNMQLHFHDSDYKLSRVRSDGHFFSSKLIEHLGGNLYRLNSAKLVGIGKHCKIGDYLTILSDKEGYPMFLERSNGIKMNDVTIYSGCVGISESYGNETQPSVYKNIKMIPGPTPLGAVTPRLFSISGTGFHCANLNKGIEVYDSVVYGNNDDAVNLHGVYQRTYENVDSKTVMIGTGHNTARFEVGDTIRFYDEKYDIIDIAKVVSSVEMPDYQPKTDLTEDVGVWTFQAVRKFKVTLDKAVKVVPGGWVENEQEMTNNFILKNCQFLEGQRGLIIKANGIVEDCLVQGRPIGMRSGPELHWLESGYIHNITFKNTTFRNNGFGGYNLDKRPLYACGLYGEPNSTSRNMNVTFDGCTFENNYYVQLFLTENQNLTIKDCTFIAGENTTKHLFIDNSENVILKNNRYEGDIPNVVKGDAISNLKEE